MFGDDLLNGKQLATTLNISTAHLYKLLSLGLPYHQLNDHSRKYYVLDEVQNWLKQAGFRQVKTWQG